MAIINVKEQFDSIKTSAVQAVKSVFPIEKRKHTLKLNDAWVEDKSGESNYSEQAKAKARGGSWGANVYADFSLIENKTGKELDRQRKVKLFLLPRLTPRASYIVKGNEYQVANQLRLRPGAYVKKTKNGSIKTQFNLARGGAAELQINNQGVIQMVVGQGKIPLYPLLIGMNVSESAIRQAWGDKLLNQNKDSRVSPQNAVKRFAQSFAKSKTTNFDTAKESIQSYIQDKTEISPEMTKLTIGKEYSKFSPMLWLDASKKLVDVERGNEDPDDVDNLAFKEFFGVDDAIIERIDKNKNALVGRIKKNLDSKTEIKKIVNIKAFGNLVESFFTDDDRSSTPEQINPLHMYANHEKVTFLGPGAIGSEQMTTDEMRNVHPTHLGFVDPVHTPECHDELTEVFTSEGWMFWRDVTPKTYLACNIEGMLEFCLPDRLIKEHYEGLMYGVKNSKLNYLVTPNHRMWVRPLDSKKDAWRFESAEKTHGVNRTFPVTHNPYKGLEVKEKKFKEIEKKSNATKYLDPVSVEDWAEFLGWYLSEGSCRYVEETSEYKIKISQSKTANPEHTAAIHSLLERIGWNFSYCDINGDFCFGCKQLAGEIVKLGKTYDKYIPEEAFNYPIEAREKLLEALLNGDGSTISNRKEGSPFKSYKQQRFTTSSPKLAKDFDKLAIGLGHSTMTKKYSDPREDRYHDIFEVRILQRDVRSARKYNRRSGISDYYTTEYSGNVYCATVPGGLLLTRRDGGIPFWSGNSSRIGLNLSMTMGTKKEGKSLVGGFFNFRTKQMEKLNPGQVYDKIVAYPDQWDPDTKQFKKDKVKAQHKGKLVVVSKNEVDYVMPFTQNAFSFSTNMIPFMANDNGNRTMMAGKHMEQAIPLKDREVPLVQSKIPVGKNTSFEETMGRSMAVYATEDGSQGSRGIAGKVKSLTKDYITITSGAKDYKIPLYNDFPLNQKTFITHEPTVNVGDQVNAGQLLADTNYSKDGTLALGKNLRVGYMAYKGYNFEDGIVITDSAAQKLTSEHIHKKQVALTAKTILSLGKFISNFPNEISGENRQKLDDEGIIKKGSKVTYGDVLVAAMRDQGGPQGVEAIKARIHKSLGKNYKNVSESWTMDVDGTVTDIQRTSDKITVLIKTSEPAKIGDKLAGRHGNKGIITKIIPDSHSPVNEDGEGVDVMFNPHGVVSRMNIGQMYESAMGKAAKKSNTPYKVNNFSGEDYLGTVKDALKKAGINDQEELTDPLTGKVLGNIHVGNPYILKLNKQSEVNFSVRGESGPVTKTTMQPTKGGQEGSKALDMLTMYSLLAHGSKANLKEMSTLKSENNPEFWEALKYGRHLPAPKTPFVFNKFVNMLKGAGVDVKKEGSRLQLAPLTDEQTKKLSKMKIEDSVFTQAKGNKIIEEKGGFLDPVKLGGISGDNWAHIELKEDMPNPVFEEAIRVLLDMTKDDYERVVSGGEKVEHNGKTFSGGPAIKAMLSKIDVEKELKETEPLLEKLRGSNLNKAVKKYRYLKSLKQNNLRPEQAYTRKLVPVVPPKFRPFSIMESGDISADDTNMLYRNVSLLSKKMELPVVDLLDDEDLKNVRSDMNKQMKGLAGLTDIKFSGRDKSGFIAQLKGKNQPKEGFYQSKVLRKNQNLVGRGTIIPEPQLHMDEAAIPEKMAWKLFNPFIIKELTRSGISAKRAKEEIEKKTPLARRTLDKAMEQRPIMLNRAPSLHKFSIMAFKPKITEGKAIKIPPLVVQGFNADYNGDSASRQELVTVKLKGKQDHIFVQPLEEIFQQVTGLSTEEMIKDAKGYTKIYDVAPGSIQTIGLTKEGLKWVDIQSLTVHTSHGPCYEIKTHTGTTGVFSEHHNFSYIDENLDLKEIKTEVMPTGVMLPKTVKSWEGELQKTTIGERKVLIDEDFAWVLGQYSTEGSVSDRTNTGRGFVTSFCETSSVALDKVASYFDKVLSYKTKLQSTSQDKDCIFRCYLNDVGRWFRDHCGVGSYNKTVPTIIMNSPKNVRLAYIASVFQGDGNIYKDSYGNFGVRLEMASKTFIRQMQVLMNSVGIFSYFTATKNKGNTYWKISIAKISLDKFPELIEEKGEMLKEAKEKYSKRKITKDSYDLVPFSSILLEDIIEINKKLKAPTKTERETIKQWRSEVVGRKINILDQTKNKKDLTYLSRETARNILHTVGMFSTPLMKKWSKIVNDNSLMWELLNEVNEVEREEVLFDFTVPEGQTFTTNNGLITHNTMTVHVPVGDKAVRESHRMFPSRNLYKPGSGSLMVGPAQESQLGFYLMTKTQEDRDILNKVLPKEFHITHEMDKKASKDLFMKLSKSMPNEEFSKLINIIKVMGEDAALSKGFSLSLKDMDVLPNKDKFLKMIERDAMKVMKDKSYMPTFSKNLEGYQDSVDKALNTHLKGKDNSFYEMFNSGARGSAGQLRQILASPLIVQDPEGNPIPKTIEKSFAEGLDLSDYWIASYGARKGMMDRALSTQEPGVFNKSLIAVTMNNVISMNDCGTKNGVKMPISDPEILGRYIEGDQAGFNDDTVVDEDVIKQMKNKGLKEVKVRSPLKCEAEKGTCQKCYGIDENGKVVEVGDNIGVKAAQTIAEPMTQLVLNTFHTGGVAGTGKKSGYARIQELINLPKDIKAGKAELAPESGTVDKIESSGLGGYNVYVNGKKKITSKGLKLKVKKGDQVRKGDPLSEGSISPQEMLDLKGMKEVQNYMTDELKKAYGSQGIEIEKKTFETIVRSMTDRTRVLSDEDDLNYSPGDTMPWTQAEKYNKTHEKKLKHKPYLTGVKYIPQNNQDWMAQMGATRVADAVINGASQGWMSDTRDYHPIPAFAHGATFGEGPDGKY